MGGDGPRENKRPQKMGQRKRSTVSLKRKKKIPQEEKEKQRQKGKLNEVLPGVKAGETGDFKKGCRNRSMQPSQLEQELTLSTRTWERGKKREGTSKKVENTNLKDHLGQDGGGGGLRQRSKREGEKKKQESRPSKAVLKKT